MTDQGDYVAVMAVDDIKESKLYPIEVNGKELLLTMVDGEVHIVDGICTHEYAQLWDGELEDGTIWCPLHSSGFCLKTGKATNPPAIDPLPIYPVRIDGGQVYVSLTPTTKAG